MFQGVIVVHRGKHDEIERNHGEIVKNGKIQKPMLPFAENGLHRTSNNIKFSQPISLLHSYIPYAIRVILL